MRPAGPTSEESTEDTNRYERLLVTELTSVKAAISSIARRHRLTRQESEDLTSEVYVKLIEDNYAVLRKFEGRSSLKTYLVVVVNRLFLDLRIKQWGKWRGSALAKRQGAAAVLFERLTCQDGLPFDEACAVMETTLGVAVDRRALEGLAGRLPRRLRRRHVSLEALEQMPPDSCQLACSGLEAFHAAQASRTMRALGAEITTLTARERRLLQRRFFEGARLQDVARDASEPPKVVYRRLAKVLTVLRRRLENRGISPLAVDLWGGPQSQGY